MNPKLTRDAIAEFIGTFMLVFVGAGAVTVATFLNAGAPAVAANVVVAALAHGLILIAIIYTFGHFSGAHVNPAVTLGLLVGGKVTLNRAVIYWLAQIAGGIVAALVLRYVFPNTTTYPQLGNTLPAAGIHSGHIIVLETLGTFFLVSTVYQAAGYGRAGNLAGFAIGFTLAAGILFIGPLTGASFNLARTLGPALVTGNLTELLSYIVGILGGGAIAGALHSSFFVPEPEGAGVASKKNK
jgi:MIP family channel proteins